jgi:hypothetical protein
MKVRTYILVLYNNPCTGRLTNDLRPLADLINIGDKLLTFDNNVAFLQTAQDVDTLTTRLNAGPLSNMQFFLADITNANRAGNMFPVAWDFLLNKDQLSPVD